MGTWFSLGGVLARWWTAGPRWLPWGVAALVLAAGAFWDYARHGGPVDSMLIALACYELARGLSQDTPESLAAAQGSVG